MKPRVGIAFTGSFCTFALVLTALEPLAQTYELFPIVSQTVYETDTRFGAAAEFRHTLKALTGHPVLHTLVEVEPIGPKQQLDLLIVAPCTGNTLAKLAAGIADSPVTLACKAHLRNGRPILLAVSSNDALAANAANLGTLLARRHYYFVPFGQDAPEEKPTSLVADFSRLSAAAAAALNGQQLEPILL